MPTIHAPDRRDMRHEDYAAVYDQVLQRVLRQLIEHDDAGPDLYVAKMTATPGEVLSIALLPREFAERFEDDEEVDSEQLLGLVKAILAGEAVVHDEATAESTNLPPPDFVIHVAAAWMDIVDNDGKQLVDRNGEPKTEPILTIALHATFGTSVQVLRIDPKLGLVARPYDPEGLEMHGSLQIADGDAPDAIGESIH